MSTIWLNRRFFDSTRGRVVSLLRRGRHTVDELAQELDLTDNAIRAHLATLERDGLVRQEGMRRGVGKPAYDYGLTIEAEHLFPKAYAPVLRELLDVLSEQMSPADLERVLRTVGQRMAAGLTSLPTGAHARLDAAVDALNDMGGLAEVEERDGRHVIQGYSCPLSTIVLRHPEVCGLVETLLSEFVGVPIREQCDRGDHSRCRFEVILIADGGATRESAGR